MTTLPKAIVQNNRATSDALQTIILLNALQTLSFCWLQFFLAFFKIFTATNEAEMRVCCTSSFEPK